MSAISPLIQQMREPLEPTPREAAIQKNAGSAVYGKDVARAMRDSLTGENSLEVPAGNDTVTISEEGRALRERMAAGKEKGPDGETVPGAKERVHTGIAGMSDDDGMTAAQRTLDSIKKQIKQVKEKLEEAKQRLAVATASGGDGGAAAPERTGEKDPAAKAAEAAEAATRSMGNAMGRAAEAESIQAEIDMLNQQLQTLNQQLQNALQGMGGGSAPVGTAGIGGVPDGPSGQGERISVN